MFDEVLAVGCDMGLGAKPRLKRGERAGDIAPGFGDDEGNAGEMRESKPVRVDPFPVLKIPDHDAQKTADHKSDNNKV